MTTITAQPTAARPGQRRPRGRVGPSFVLIALGAFSLTTAGTAGMGTASAASPTVLVGANATFGAILTTASGVALYTLDTDHNRQSTCHGSCAAVWPPLNVSAGTTATGGPGVTGTVGTALQSNGTLQVTYNGSPLYTFVSDSAPGQVTGNGVSGFFVVKVSPAASTTTTAPAGPAPTATAAPSGPAGAPAPVTNSSDAAPSTAASGTSAGHDVGHPGLTRLHGCRTGTPVALRGGPDPPAPRRSPGLLIDSDAHQTRAVARSLRPRGTFSSRCRRGRLRALPPIKITVRVHPRASRPRRRWDGTCLELWISQPPVDGAANAAVVDEVARWLGIRRHLVHMVSGHTARTKVLAVEATAHLPPPDAPLEGVDL